MIRNANVQYWYFQKFSFLVKYICGLLANCASGESCPAVTSPALNPYNTHHTSKRYTIMYHNCIITYLFSYFLLHRGNSSWFKKHSIKMATAKAANPMNWKRSFNMDNQDILICDICTEPYDNKTRVPKFLSCHHTVCERCLQIVAGDQANIDCPTCRQVSKLGRWSPG